jgi:hypothetical protein
VQPGRKRGPWVYGLVNQGQEAAPAAGRGTEPEPVTACGGSTGTGRGAFESADLRSGFPAPPVRLPEGEPVPVALTDCRTVRTVPWPDTGSRPGRPAASFEVARRSPGRWIPEPGIPGDPDTGTAGTYFYRCRPGLPGAPEILGALVIDPVHHPDFPVTAGARRAFVDGPEYDPGTETILIAAPQDPGTEDTNTENTGAETTGPQELRLYAWQPADSPTNLKPLPVALDANVAPGPKQPTLLRVLNACTRPVTARFTRPAAAPAPIAQLIAYAGRPLRDTSDPAGPAPPTWATAHPLVTAVIEVPPGGRCDLLLEPPAPGTYLLTVGPPGPGGHTTTAHITAAHITLTAA